MTEVNSSDLACRHCRFYQHLGRRGGSCQKLGVSVDSHWEACMLAILPFEDNLAKLETALMTLEDILHLETAFYLSGKSLKSSSPQGNSTLNKTSFK